MTLATRLLKSTPMHNLTNLDVSFLLFQVGALFDEPTLRKIRPMTKSLIKHIKQAPALEDFTLRFSVLGLNDMEVIHDSTPKLQKIHLYATAISGGDTNSMIVSADRKTILNSNGKVIPHDIATSVKDISISFFLHVKGNGAHNVMGVLQNTMVKWLTYISCKYNQTENVSLQGWENGYLPEIPSFQQPILKIISKMSQVTSYHAFLYPVTKSVMDVMNCNKKNLEKVYLYTNDFTKLSAQLYQIQNSEQAKNIKYLDIDATSMDLTDRQTMINELVPKRFEGLFLTNLAISCNVHYSALANILKLSPTLLCLYVNSVLIDSHQQVPILPVNKCQLKILEIGLDYKNKTFKIYHADQVMRFVLSSCPLLTHFTFDANLVSCASGCLELNLSRHARLKIIDIHAKGAIYFSLSLKNGTKKLVRGEEINIELNILCRSLLTKMERLPNLT